MTVTIDEGRFGALASSFAGTLLRPADAGYEEARRVHNGLVDRRPALIARCTSAPDAAAALAFARDSGLPVSVRGGGHNIAGRAVIDDGVTVDLSPMKGIDVDPSSKTVRAGGGVVWSEFNAATADHGLATTGGLVSTTGIAGLTLGGGLGWLMPRYGLAADNLVSVELVLASGEIVRVSEEHHPDLFWALRGGGGNFGVATTFEYRLHPVTEVVAGLVAYPFDAARDVLRFLGEFTGGALSDDLMVVGALVHAPDGSGAKLAAAVVCHTGSKEEADRELEPLLGFGSPALTQVGPMPYPVANTLLDEAYPKGALNYWKSGFLRGLDGGTIDTIVEQFSSTPSPMTAIGIEHFHGAVTRVGVTETAVPHREPGHNMFITSVWNDPETTAANIAWTREAFGAIGPHLADRRWLNYLDDDDASDAIRAAYGPNYQRLADVKGLYDPGNIFRSNHNIEPASAA
jgi:FAD/FMN-containing dehydrogenase